MDTVPHGKKHIINPEKSIDVIPSWNGVFGNSKNYYNGATFYPPKSFFTFHSQYMDMTFDVQNLSFFNSVNIATDYSDQVWLPAQAKYAVGYHASVRLNSLVPYRYAINFSGGATDVGTPINGQAFFNVMYTKYRVISVDIEIIPKVPARTITDGVWSYIEGRYGVLLTHGALDIATPHNTRIRDQLEMGQLKTCPFVVHADSTAGVRFNSKRLHIKTNIMANFEAETVNNSDPAQFSASLGANQASITDPAVRLHMTPFIYVKQNAGNDTIVRPLEFDIKIKHHTLLFDPKYLAADG